MEAVQNRASLAPTTPNVSLIGPNLLAGAVPLNNQEVYYVPMPMKRDKASNNTSEVLMPVHLTPDSSNFMSRQNILDGLQYKVKV